MTSIGRPQCREPNRDDVSQETGLNLDRSQKKPAMLWAFKHAGVGQVWLRRRAIGPLGLVPNAFPRYSILRLCNISRSQNVAM